MPTLQEILEKEKRVLFDTCALPFSKCESDSEEIQNIDEFSKYLVDSAPIYVVPEVLDEISHLRRFSKRWIKDLKGRMKNFRNNSELKSTHDLAVSKQQKVKRLIDKLKEKVLNFKNEPAYQSLMNLVCYMQDVLHIKKEEDKTDLRTDEANIAAALFLSIYRSEKTAVLSNDNDFPNLLGYTMREICRPKLIDLTGEILKHIMSENTGISIYTSLEDGNYVLRFHSKNNYSGAPRIRDIEKLRQMLAQLP